MQWNIGLGIGVVVMYRFARGMSFKIVKCAWMNVLEYIKCRGEAGKDFLL